MNWHEIYKALLKEPYQWHPDVTAKTPIVQLWRLLMSTEGVWKPVDGRLTIKRKKSTGKTAVG